MEKKEIEIRDLFIEVRNQLKLTQNEFANELGISRSLVAKIENKEIFVSEKLMYFFLTKYRHLVEGYSIYTDNPKGQSSIKGQKNGRGKFFDQIMKFFDEEGDNNNIQHYENPNSAFVKNMQRLVFLEKENKELKEKLAAQNEYIRNFLNKDYL